MPRSSSQRRAVTSVLGADPVEHAVAPRDVLEVGLDLGLRRVAARPVAGWARTRTRRDATGRRRRRPDRCCGARRRRSARRARRRSRRRSPRGSSMTAAPTPPKPPPTTATEGFPRQGTDSLLCVNVSVAATGGSRLSGGHYRSAPGRSRDEAQLPGCAGQGEHALDVGRPPLDEEAAGRSPDRASMQRITRRPAQSMNVRPLRSSTIRSASESRAAPSSRASAWLDEGRARRRRETVRPALPAAPQPQSSNITSREPLTHRPLVAGEDRVDGRVHRPVQLRRPSSGRPARDTRSTRPPSGTRRRGRAGAPGGAPRARRAG